MPQSEIHPEWYPEAEVVFDGEVVMKVGSTKPRIVVDVWSGSHPFFTGEQRLLDTEGQVDRFMRRLRARQEIAAEQEQTVIEKDPRSADIRTIGLDSRAQESLIEANMVNAGDLADALEEGDDVLLAIPGIGQTALITIKRYLRNEELID